jgi:hypothetical protein
VIISINGIRQFRRCARQWSYDTLIASAHVKPDSPRREVHLLSQVQSVAAWRGNLVDQIITRRVLPAIEKGWHVKPCNLLAYARTMFHDQLVFARQNRMREPGMTKEKAADSFAALASVEYGLGLSEDEVEQAWTDVEKALTNLLEMQELLALMQKADKLIAQRPLTFPHFQVNFRAVPDVIAFFTDEPPLIVDWKVHFKGTHDYRLQLAAYALALIRCNPHSDFPCSLSRWSPTDIRLIEAQLLTQQQREYKLSDDDIAEVDDYIADAAIEMMLAADGKSNGDIDPFDFPVTANPENCRWCPFRRICTEDVKCQKPVQMTFL